jgi:predicted acyltransferase
MLNRLLSLDIFRGLTIALMIIVNTPGSWSHVFRPLDHAKWHGCTPTDWVFPSFLFAIGLSMRFSFKPFNYELNAVVLGKIFKRAIIIYLLYIVFMQFLPFYYYDDVGVFLWGRKNPVRYLGVLPRLAICYALASIICLSVKRTWLPYILGGILLGYWAIMYFYGDAGNPYGMIPSAEQFIGMSDADVTAWWKAQMQTNAGFKLDLAVLGENHIYKGEGYPFEPEGILSTLPSIATVMAGYMVATYIQDEPNREKVIKNLILAGAVCVGVSLLWDFVFPINKKLWTSSYVVHMAGIDMLVLGILTYILDYKGITKWSFFFEVFGANAIAAYLISEVPIVLGLRYKIAEPDGKLVSTYGWVYRHWFASWAGPMNGSFFFALWFMLMCWLVLYVMYKKKIFLKV